MQLYSLAGASHERIGHLLVVDRELKFIGLDGNSGLSLESALDKFAFVGLPDVAFVNHIVELASLHAFAKDEVELAQANYLQAQAEVAAARAEVSAAQASLSNNMTNLGYSRITSPVDGTVISRKIDLSQPDAASFQAPELFTIAQDLKKMQIEVNVSEADIGKVKNGQDVTYTLDGYPDDVFKTTDYK